MDELSNGIACLQLQNCSIEVLREKCIVLQTKYKEKVKEVAEQEKELEKVFGDYERITKKLARRHCDTQDQRERYEQLLAEIKLQRVRCKTMECDVVVVQQENETFSRRVKELEGRARDLLEGCQCILADRRANGIDSRQTNESPQPRTETVSPDTSPHMLQEMEDIDHVRELYNDVIAVESDVLQLSAEIAEKNRNIETRNGISQSFTPLKALTPITPIITISRSRCEDNVDKKRSVEKYMKPIRSPLEFHQEQNSKSPQRFTKYKKSF